MHFLCVHITTTCGEMMMTLILLTSPPPRQNRTKAEAYARDEIASRLLLQSRLPFPSIAGYTGLTDEEVRQLAVRIWKR